MILQNRLFKKQKGLLTSFSSRGQMTVEFILMIVVGVFMMQLLINNIKGNASLDNFVVGPNKLIGHMIANGSWKTDTNQSKNDHPNRYKRRWSWKP